MSQDIMECLGNVHLHSHIYYYLNIMDIIFSSFISLYLFSSRKHWCLSCIYVSFPHKCYKPNKRFQVINQYYTYETFCRIMEKKILYVRVYTHKIYKYDCWLKVAFISVSFLEKGDRKWTKNWAKSWSLYEGLRLIWFFSCVVARFLSTLLFILYNY